VILLYIDPGAGSIVVQALIAGALMVPFVLRRAIRRGVSRLRGRLDDGKTD
jgi:hypothetical protein